MSSVIGHRYQWDYLFFRSIWNMIKKKNLFEGSSCLKSGPVLRCNEGCGVWVLEESFQYMSVKLEMDLLLTTSQTEDIGFLAHNSW